MNLLAQMPPIDQIAPAVVAILVFMIPIISILTKHQRQMAELIHGQGERKGDVSPLVMDRLVSLEREVLELKDLVRKQVIALDDLRVAPKSLGSDLEDLPSRVGGS